MSLEVKNIPEAEVKIVGSGEVGDKAQQLIDETPALRGLGFYTPRRVVLAERFFDGFFARNQLGSNLREVPATPDITARINRGDFTADEFEALQQARHENNGMPLAIRSSAVGDARGTGIYDSRFTENTVMGVKRSVQAVLGSYFTEDAQAFRRDAKTGDGFGMIIEPLAGQDLGGYIAPVLSGFGYTSTSREGAYAVAVPGIGGGVDTKNGERLTRDNLEHYEGSLDEYIDRQQYLMVAGNLPARRSLLLGTASNWILGTSYTYGDVFFPRNEYHPAEVRQMFFDHRSQWSEQIKEVNMLGFFDKIDKMESVFGKPQYFEWTMTTDAGDPKYWITQIADTSNKMDMLDFDNLGEELYTGNSVVGSGIKECPKIVYCSTSDDLAKMRAFNARNKDYVLVFSSSMISKGASHVRKLQYGDCFNAGVFLERPEEKHANDPIDHFKGIMDLTDKLFAIYEPLPMTRESMEKIDRQKRLEKDEDGLRVIEGKIKVVASERQNRMVIALQQ